jgi:small GTP-binding protein
MDLLTPGGMAGIAVVRVGHGERATVLGKLRRGDSRPFGLRRGPPQRALLRLDDVDIDDVLVVDRGDGGLELHLHGSPAILAALARHFEMAPAEPASAAARLLRSALGLPQLQLAIEQLGLDFEAGLAALCAMPPATRRREHAAAIQRSRHALAAIVPQRVALVGEQNAGKSSLFNALLARERALTGPLAGLTRDPVREVALLDGYPYELVDTPGAGDACGAVDAAAQARGRSERQGALAVLVIDAALGPSVRDLALLPECVAVVASKSDLPPAAWPERVPRSLAVSAMHDDGSVLRSAFGALLRNRRHLPPAGPVAGFAALDADQWSRLQRCVP